MELCRLLRADTIASPILILNTRATVDDIVVGLNNGADDYLGRSRGPTGVAGAYPRPFAVIARRQRRCP